MYSLLTAAMIIKRDSSDIQVINCDFIENYSTEYGGGIYLEENNINILLSGCTFSGNYAIQGGGAVYSHMDNYDIRIRDCIFENNEVGVTANGGVR